MSVRLSQALCTMLLATSAGVALPAFAEPLLAGSTHAVSLVSDSGTDSWVATTGAGAATRTRHLGGSTGLFSFSESQASLGGGQYRLSFVFSGQLAAADDNVLGVAVGGLGDALDLDGVYDLVNSVTRVYDSAGHLMAIGGAASPGVAPWDGSWPGPVGAAGFAGSVGAIARFELDLNVAQIPEPGALSLLALALGAAALARRRTAV